MLLGGASALALAIAASGAVAADLLPPMEPIVAPPPAPTWNWTGFYIGAHGGWGWAERDWDGTFFSSEEIDDEFFEYDMDGALAGAQIGAQFQAGHFVLGVEGDVSVTSIRDDLEEFGGLVDVAVDMDWFATARARLGVAFNRFMIYGTGGVAGARVNTDLNLIGGLFSEPESAEHFGWTAGGGIEGMVNDHVSAKLEYLFADFEDEDFNYFDVFGTECPTSAGICGDADLTVQLVRAGINARF
jgi:outer membrane immunogenic protein